MRVAPEPDREEGRYLFPPLAHWFVLPLLLLCLAVSATYVVTLVRERQAPAAPLTPEDNTALDRAAEMLDAPADALFDDSNAAENEVK
jgi:hypothetical protein